MKYCEKCGQELHDDSEFCNKCGTKCRDNESISQSIIIGNHINSEDVLHNVEEIVKPKQIEEVVPLNKAEESHINQNESKSINGVAVFLLVISLIIGIVAVNLMTQSLMEVVLNDCPYVSGPGLQFRIDFNSTCEWIVGIIGYLLTEAELSSAYTFFGAIRIIFWIIIIFSVIELFVVFGKMIAAITKDSELKDFFNNKVYSAIGCKAFVVTIIIYFNVIKGYLGEINEISLTSSVIWVIVIAGAQIIINIIYQQVTKNESESRP